MTGRRIILAALLGLAAFSAGSSAAGAQTIGFAEAYDRIAKSCGRDIERHCSSVPLGRGAVRACLQQKSAEISEGCKATLEPTFALLDKRIAAQASAVKVCEHDIRQYCKGVQPHDGYILQCLLKATRVVSASCKQIIVDAGWNE
ncbi:cysteine rich repeat-containing protein [Alsobacter sp. R-9]